MNKIIKKLFLILPILLVVLSLSGCDMKGKGQGKLQEFDLNGTKVSFVPPQGWECGVFPLQLHLDEGANALLCAKEISSDTMNAIESSYVDSKGSGPYYDEIVKNNFGELIFLYTGDLEKQFVLNDEHFDADYLRSKLITVANKQFRSTIVTKGRKNASTTIFPGTQEESIFMISILPEDQTATLEPTEKVRQILETISMEEGDE